MVLNEGKASATDATWRLWSPSSLLRVAPGVEGLHCPPRTGGNVPSTERSEAQIRSLQDDLEAQRQQAVETVEKYLERVMNSIRNGLGMRETEIAREPSRP